MPTIIDELVVTLGLDPKAFKKGEKETVKGFNTVRQESSRTAKDMEAGGKRAAQFYSEIKTEVLSLIGVMIGAKGLESAIVGTTNSLASLGRDARNIGMSGHALRAFTNVIEQNGGSAEGATSSLQGLAQQIQNFKTFGDPSILKWLNPIGADINESPIGIFMKFLKFAQEHRDNPIFVGQVGRGLGFDSGTINAVEQIKTLAEYQREYNEALKDAPTQQQIDDATELQRQWIALEQAGKSLSQTIVSDLTPTMISLTEKTRDWIEVNKGWIADDLTGKVHHLGDDMTYVADHLKDWKSTGELVAAYFAGPFAIAIMAGLGPVAAAVAAIVAGLAMIDKSRSGASLETLSVDSPLWAGVSDQEQGNYVNSPRSQSFLHPGNPNPYSPLNPGSWRGRQPTPLESAQRKTNADAIARYFLGQGYTSEQVAGILANAEAESSFNPMAVNGSMFGLFQWDPNRQADFARLFGHDIHKSTLQEQLEFAQWELTHTEKAAGDRLRRAQTKRQSAGVFATGYERTSGGALEVEHREELAERYAPSPSAAYVGARPAGSTITINGGITVNTQATDAKGIARDLNAAIAAQANRGLQ